MDHLLNITRNISRFLAIIAGIALTFIMVLTVSDVILRNFGMPIKGSYELVAFAGSLVIGLAIPITSWMRGQIQVDFILAKLSQKARAIFNVVTRLLGGALFVLLGWNLFLLGANMHRAGEVSLTLQMPIHPIIYGIAVACLVQCLVLFGDLVKIARGEYE